MDRFRVYALEKALGLGLTKEQESFVSQEIANKCRILIKGFQKRNNRSETERYQALIEKYAHWGAEGPQRREGR